MEFQGVNYKVHPGIVLIKVGTVPLLVATRGAWATCKHSLRLNATSAMIWKALEKDKPLDAQINFWASIRRSSRESIEQSMNELINKFIEAGYLIPSCK